MEVSIRISITYSNDLECMQMWSLLNGDCVATAIQLWNWTGLYLNWNFTAAEITVSFWLITGRKEIFYKAMFPFVYLKWFLFPQLWLNRLKLILKPSWRNLRQRDWHWFCLKFMLTLFLKRSSPLKQILPSL